MQSGFSFISNLISDTTDAVIRRIDKAVRTTETSISSVAPFLHKIEPVYPWLEVSFLFIYWVEVFLLLHEKESIRKPLLDFIVDNLVRNKQLERTYAVKIMNKRMEEYFDLGFDAANRNTLFIPNSLNYVLIDGFTNNLAYAFFKGDCFYWEGNIKPIPLLSGVTQLDSLVFQAAAQVYYEVVVHYEIRLRKNLRELFASDIDLYQLNNHELE